MKRWQGVQIKLWKYVHSDFSKKPDLFRDTFIDEVFEYPKMWERLHSEKYTWGPTADLKSNFFNNHGT